MSLTALAVRLSTVYALRGQTLAGNNVKDSPQNPLPALLDGPQIVVYTGRHSTATEGKQLVGGDQTFDLSIHVHLPQSVDVTDGTRTLRLDQSSGGVGVVYDVIWRQIVRALMAAPGPWPEVWRSFVVKVGDVESEPFLIEAGAGQRVMARGYVLGIETIHEPGFGAVEAGTPWAMLLEAMRGEPALLPLADVVEHEIAALDELPEWSKTRAALGLTEAGLAAIGLAPLTSDMVDPAVEFTVDDPKAGNVVVNPATPDPGDLP
jgi:hypothetical protein